MRTLPFLKNYQNLLHFTIALTNSVDIPPKNEAPKAQPDWKNYKKLFHSTIALQQVWTLKLSKCITFYHSTNK